jgi:hypothetical protein
MHQNLQEFARMGPMFTNNHYFWQLHTYALFLSEPFLTFSRMVIYVHELLYFESPTSLANMARATLWAILLQTDLVILVVRYYGFREN